MKLKTLLCSTTIALLIQLTIPIRLAASETKHFTTFDAPGAGIGAGEGTVPQQNTPKGTIVGYYVDGNGVSHGFVRDPRGGFTTFDAPDAGTAEGQGTLAFGIAYPTCEEVALVGYYVDANGVLHGYIARWQDTDAEFIALDFRTFDAPAAGMSSGQGTLGLSINPRRDISGIYIDGQGVFHGFARADDGRITSFDPPDSAATFGDTLGLNPEGVITGGYQDTGGVFHGYRRAADGTITVLNSPGAGTAPNQGSVANSINQAGVIPGYYFDENGVVHAFLRAPDGKFTTFDAPGAGTASGQGTQASATAHGVTTGFYIDGMGVNHGFVRGREGKIITLDAPGAGTSPGQGTFGSSINPEGAVVGDYIDMNNALHGFVWNREEK